MPVIGTLIAESLRVNSVIEGVTLEVTKVSCSDVGDVAAGQPRTWTFIEFAVADGEVDDLARSLERALDPDGGWYCDFRSDDETFVVFADRTFRYPRGDARGRAAAAAYGRSMGVPESQLDWPL
jgi:hypothetical protein